MPGFQPVRVREARATEAKLERVVPADRGERPGQVQGGAGRADGQVADGPVGVHGHRPDGAGGGVDGDQPDPPPVGDAGEGAAGEQGAAGLGRESTAALGCGPKAGVGDGIAPAEGRCAR
jgi:hypothetical protein